MSECPLCRLDPIQVIWRGRWVTALWDQFPVSPDHALIVSRRHVADWFALCRREHEEMLDGIAAIRKHIVASRHVDGWNLGVNIDAAGGQTVAHAHLHVIPRYAGDVDDPRGGIRNVIPHLGNYLKQEGG